MMMPNPRFRQFLDWWLAGLALLLPESLRNRLRHHSNQLHIHIRNNNYTFRLYKSGTTEISEEWSISGEEPEKPAAWGKLDELVKEDTVITVIVPAEMVLMKNMTLPLTAAGNLREILRFEMDKQTPFSADKVWYDWYETGRDNDNNKLHIELLVCLKESLRPVISMLKELGIQPHTARPEQTDNGAPINLLPEEERPYKDHGSNNVTRILVATTLILFLIALYAPLLKREAVLADMDSRIAELREQAVEVQELLSERENILSRIRFLEEKRRERIATIDVIRELTRVLPDNTSLTRLTIRDEELQLYGESDTATSVIELIEDSDYFADVQFKAPIVRNSATGKDRFQLSAAFERPDKT